MKLVRQIQLVLAGAVEKIYEVDLCEVGPDQFVVNYRYGRRGKALQDGSVTALPVRRTEAERLFDETVATRRAKGYRDVSGAATPPTHAATPPTRTAPLPARTASPPIAPTPSATASPPRPIAPPVAGPAAASPTKAAARPPLDLPTRVLLRLRAGEAKYHSWPLERAIWRAGELSLTAAEPELIDYLEARTSNNLRKYSAIWALRRCGGRASVGPLVKLYEDKATPLFIKRVAAETLRHLLSEKERDGLIARECDLLPPKLAALARTGPARAFEKALFELFATDKQVATDAYWTAYFIANEHTMPAVLRLCRTAPLERPYFRVLRALFKSAELRSDGRVYGILAHRFESTAARHDEHGIRSATQARPFSARTRNYYRWRTWRSLDRLGGSGSDDFTKMATGVLLPYTDDDAKNEGRFWSFCSLLYRHSTHVVPGPARHFFIGRPGRAAQRTEAFPALWDAAPRALMHLLDASQCESVHVFAVRALRDNQAFLASLDLEPIVMLLERPYAVTSALGFELAKKRLDPQNPDKRLLLALVQSSHLAARAEGQRAIEQCRPLVLDDSAFLCDLCFSKHADTRAFVKDLLRSSTLARDTATALVGRCVAAVLALGEAADPRVDDVSDILLHALTVHIDGLGADVLRDLIEHPMPRVQELGGDLLSVNSALSQKPPSDLLMALLRGKHPAVRATGVTLLGNLPDGEVAARPELLFALATSEHTDLRDSVRPILARALRARAELGTEVGQLLLERLRFSAERELHAHVADILRHELAATLRSLPPNEIMRLLRSRFAHAQELGGELLRTGVAPDTIDLADLVRLVDHEILAVREACWHLCNESVARLQRAPERALSLLDTKWEDSRAWAMNFVRENFDQTTLSPALLVSICDSVRPEVQGFGRELITRYFDPQYGPDYLLKLSEHPSEALQLYSTNYLERFASGRPAEIARLAHYFTAILSRVNKGRLAKTRTLAFLEREALASAEAAELIAPILARQVVTISIESRAALIQTMVRVHEQYPHIPMPLTVETPASHGAARGV